MSDSGKKKPIRNSQDGKPALNEALQASGLISVVWKELECVFMSVGEDGCSTTGYPVEASLSRTCAYVNQMHKK